MGLRVQSVCAKCYQRIIEVERVTCCEVGRQRRKEIRYAILEGVWVELEGTDMGGPHLVL